MIANDFVSFRHAMMTFFNAHVDSNLEHLVNHLMKTLNESSFAIQVDPSGIKAVKILRGEK